MQVFYRTFSGETGGRVGGGGQVSACSDLPGPGRGFGGGGDGVEDRAVRDVTHLVLRLQHETSGQEEDERTGAEQIQTHLVWTAVVHPVLPVTVEAAGTSAEMRNAGLFRVILNSEMAAQAAWGQSVWGGIQAVTAHDKAAVSRSKISNNPKRKAALRWGKC